MICNIEKNGAKKLYFVVETKGSILAEDLRDKEIKKIECGRKHFEAIDTGVKFEPTDNFEKFIENAK